MNSQICRCGGEKSLESQRCQSCKKQDDYDAMMTKPMKDYLCIHPQAKAKYNNVRKCARRTMERYGPQKECQMCGFYVVVEVCHIKGLTEFSENALMSEVNALSNLVYLCPNHHAMFDRGLIDITSPHRLVVDR